MKLQSEIIKQYAQKQGFDLCGIAKAEFLVFEKKCFEEALAQNFHANKAYLERDIEKRFHPQKILDNCKTVVVCGFNYNTRNSKSEICIAKQAKISQYVQIKDYHVFMKEKLGTLARSLQEKCGIFNYKITVDSSVISEKAWAVKAGIGYYGKNGIIQTTFGSFIFLGILLMDVDVDIYDNPNRNSCGTCCKCIAACPAKAIVAPYQVDSNHCVSNTNLNKHETDFSKIAKYGWLIGCDECQNICPNNTNAPVNEEAVSLRASFAENQEDVLPNLTPESFEQYFKDSVIYKFQYDGLLNRLNKIISTN